MSTMETPARRLASMLAKYDPATAKVARATLAVMTKRMPGATRLAYDNYNALVVGYSPSPKPSEAVFSIAIYPDHVTLVFIRGIDVPDPTKRLRGSGNQVRHIRLERGAATLSEPDVRALMRAALARGKPMPKRGGKLVIQSVSARQCPRRRDGSASVRQAGRGAAFRSTALALPGVTEAEHRGHPDFRVGGKTIFATLSADETLGHARLPPPLAKRLLGAHRDIIVGVGQWETGGWVRLRLADAPVSLVRDMLRAAHTHARDA
jgi:hypothetical protein